MITIEECTLIGKITKTHGLNGNLVLRAEDSTIEDFREEPVFLLLEGRPVPFFITPDSLTPHGKSNYILHFDGIDSEEVASRFVGVELFVESALLESDTMENRVLLNYRVEDENSNKSGVVTDISDYSGNILLTLDIEGREVLLPLVEHYVSEIDSEAKIIHVNIPDELFRLN